MKKDLTLLFFSILSIASAFSQEALLGKWLTQDKDGVVEIYRDGNTYYGKIVKLIPEKTPDGTPILDAFNSDKSKRSRPVLGIQTIADFNWNGEELEGGKVYDPKEGKFYKGKIWLEGENLKMRGYLGFLYRTETWTRFK